MAAELRELRGFGVVAQRDVSFERGFVTEQFVFVGFVWPDRDVDRRVEIHPGHIAVVVIVGSKSIGALVEKVSQRRVGRQRRRFAQQLRGRFEKLFVLLAVRNDRQLLVRSAANQVKEAGGFLLFSFRQSCQPTR